MSEPKGYGVLNGVVPSVPGENTEATTVSKLEHDALITTAMEIQSSLGEESVGEWPVSHGKLIGLEKGKRKERVSVQKDKTKGNTSKCRKSTRNAKKGIDANLFAENEGGGDDAVQGPIHAKPLPLVQFYAIDSDQHILREIEPSAIVVYHPDISFVREIEIYKAEHPSKKLKVHFLFYEDSTEVQKFEASIRRENGAFESLIRQKSLMMIPVDQDSRCSELSATSTELQSLTVQNALTQKSSGRKSEQKEMQIIVDVREFVSSLLKVLHQKGIRIIALEVGDYILSPLICVERKSISDLYSRFASGHLYHQTEKMSRYYQIPVLLIEFSQDQSFSFQSVNDIGDDVSPTNIISKLSLLVMHFPRLRLVWSRSLHAIAEIFASLKSNQDEPDENKAMRVGVPSEDGIVEDDMRLRADNYNTSAVDFMRRLPGVTDFNYRISWMVGCSSLSELALLPVEKPAQLMGGQKAVHTLRDFIDAKCPTML